jgi:Ser/Thr protein kinase RdoA (MazF antagonist)
VTVRELPSYDDQNFHLRDAAGDEYVLKISNSSEEPGLLDAQVSVLELLQARPGRLETPRVIRCSTGTTVIREGAHLVWLVTFLPGRVLADVAEPPGALLRGLGEGLGDLDRRLETFDHPAARRIYEWDLRQAPGALRLVDHIADRTGRETVRAALSRFQSERLPEVDRLPFQVIHGDANDHNLLVRGEGAAGRIGGLLDFGDLVWTARACEPAIAMTYAMLPAADPLEAGALVLAGYHETRGLSRSEIRLLPHLIEARLSVSVTMSAYRRKQEPANEYLSLAEAPAWRLIEWMSTTPPSRWTPIFEDACDASHSIDGNAVPERTTDEA